MSDKSYAAATGNITTDWPRVIERLDTMSEEELTKYFDLAMNWPTCACGNQCAIIPRDRAGAPVDNSLVTDGSRFPWALDARDKVRARFYWQAIEARAAIVVAETLAQLNVK